LTLAINNQQNKIAVSDELIDLLNKATQKVLVEEKVSPQVEVSLCFVDIKYIRELNYKYRNRDEATDVLSFLQEEELGGSLESTLEEPEVLLGDIVISLEKAEEQSQAAGHSFNREVALLFIHGMLHLLGYKHDSEEEYEKIFNRTEKIMEAINYQEL